MHFPAFEKLCALADKHKLHVGLRVGEPVSFAQRRGEEHGRITLIELHYPGVSRTAYIEPVFGEDIEAAALKLLQRVA